MKVMNQKYSDIYMIKNVSSISNVFVPTSAFITPELRLTID